YHCPVLLPDSRTSELYTLSLHDALPIWIDPALLEYAGGNTFSGRVFPIPPKGYNRVLIAYEELLPVASAKVQYRFPLPDCKLAEDRKSTRLNSSHLGISYAVFCLKKKNT